LDDGRYHVAACNDGEVGIVLTIFHVRFIKSAMNFEKLYNESSDSAYFGAYEDVHDAIKRIQAAGMYMSDDYRVGVILDTDFLTLDRCTLEIKYTCAYSSLNH